MNEQEILDNLSIEKLQEELKKRQMKTKKNIPTNKEMIDNYLSYYKSKYSRKSRRSAIRNFQRCYNSGRSFLELKQKDLNTYFRSLNNSESYTLETKKYRWICVCRLVQCINEDYEEYLDNPIVIPKFSINWGNIHKEGISNKDIIATRKEVYRILQYPKDVNENKKHYVLFRLMIETGCRVGELVSIKTEWLNTEKRYVKVKGKMGFKYYYFTGDFAEIIDDYKEDYKPEEYLFTSWFKTPYSVETVSSFLKHIRKALKIDYEEKSRRITCHTFRRTINTLRYKNGLKDLNQLKILLNQRVRDINYQSYVKENYEDFIKLYDDNFPYDKTKL